MSRLDCPACRREIALAEGVLGVQAIACPHCRIGLELETFPAFWRTAPAGRTGELVTGEEAGCFVHPDRRAEAACDRCGRFMCALCEVHVGDQRLCVACLEEGRRGGRLAQVERARLIHALAASRLALLSILLGPFAPLAGLPAIVLAVWGLARPRSMTGRRYAWAAGSAILLGGLLSTLWLAWWVRLFA